MYRLNLLVKIKIYPIQYIAMLELVYRDVELLAYNLDIYRGQEEDEQQVLKVINYKDINNKIQYKVQQIGYNKTTQELLKNLKKNAIRKVQEYQKKIGQVVLIEKDY